MRQETLSVDESAHKKIIFLACFCLLAIPQAVAEDMPRSANYASVQRRLATGWNTWDNNRVSTFASLPSGHAFHVEMVNNSGE